MKRVLPSPPLSVLLFAVWLLLTQSLHPATLLMAATVAIAVPLLTRSLRPARVHMRKPLVALQLSGRVLADLSRSALSVARLLLTRRTPAIDSRFVYVPLELRDPNGLAVLAMILCLTPGTAWAELAFDRSMLLVHLFNLDNGDEAAFIAQIKTRYERSLMEIFE